MEAHSKSLKTFFSSVTVMTSMTMYPFTSMCSKFQTYSNCSCVVFDRNSTSPDYEAIEGKCASSCNYLPLFMPFFAILMLLTFIASMPALSATLR